MHRRYGLVRRIAPVAVCCAVLAAAGLLPAGASGDTTARRAEFLSLADLAVAEFNKPITRFVNRDSTDPTSHHVPFFEDSYGIRAVNVAYEMTGDSKYLDAARLWSDRMATYQSHMIPTGAYYLNYGYSGYRQQYSSSGQWFVADSSTVGMGVLSTLVRAADAADRSRYSSSVQSYSNLVVNNFIQPGGGITDGYWNANPSGPWWCSTATFGAMAYLLYDQTGNSQHLQAASNAMDWMLAFDLNTLQQGDAVGMGPTRALYVGEFFAAALDHVAANDPRRPAILAKVDFLIDWMANNQITQNPASTMDYGDTHTAGLPYVQAVFGRELGRSDLIAAAAEELDHIDGIIHQSGTPNPSALLTWERMTWGMMGYAELLKPASLFAAVTWLSGDANRDGVVNGADLNTVLSHYNGTVTGDTWLYGDFNADGVVNGADLNAVLSHYNQSAALEAGQVGSVPHGGAVPEPSSLLLAAIGLACLLGTRRVGIGSS
jgi:hypothetical protein